MTVQYVSKHKIWSVHQINAPAKAGYSVSTSVWSILKTSMNGSCDAIVREHFQDYGVCLVQYIDALEQFVVFSRRRTVCTYTYRNAYSPTLLKLRSFVEVVRPPLHFPFDAVSCCYCPSAKILMVGTLDGSIVGIPLLSEDWATPSYVIKSCADDAVVALASLPKINKIVCFSFVNRIKVVDTERQTVSDGLQVAPSHGGIRHALLAEDLHLMVTCGHSTAIALWALSFPATNASTSRSYLIGTLNDTSHPHVAPLIAISRGEDKSGIHPKTRNKLFSVDSIGNVKIWDLTTRCGVSRCSQPSLFRAYGAGFALMHKSAPLKNASTLDQDLNDDFDAIIVKVAGVDVVNHRVEVREVVISLGDDFAEPQDDSKAIPVINPAVGAKPSALTDSMRKGKNLVHSGNSLVTKTISRLLTNPYHIGTFDVDEMGCLVSVTNNFIVLLERRTSRFLNRYSRFPGAITAANVTSGDWRYSKMIFVAFEASSVILGINLGNGDTAVKMQMYDQSSHGSVKSKRDVISLIAIPHRNLIVSANGEGCVAVFQLPRTEREMTSESLKPIHFLRCTWSFITRMAYHKSADILAIGDGKGVLSQWEVTPTVFSRCTRIRQSTMEDYDPTLPTENEAGESENGNTDRHIRRIVLDESLVEITALEALDPIRAFAVATSDLKVSIWTTVPFDVALAIFSWECHVPRSVDEPQFGKQVVTALHVDSDFTIQMIDDQGGWSSWDMGDALRESQLIRDVDSLYSPDSKWSAKELATGMRPPLLVASVKLTQSDTLPLVGLQPTLVEAHNNKHGALVSVSNGDALIIDSEGTILSIVQPTIRRDVSRKFKRFETDSSILYTYDRRKTKLPEIATFNSDSHPMCETGILETSPVLFPDTLCPPPTPTNYQSVAPRLRVSSAGQPKRPLIPIVSYKPTIVKTPHLNADSLLKRLQNVEKQTFEARLASKAPPSLYPPNLTIALSAPFAYMLNGLSEEDCEPIVGTPHFITHAVLLSNEVIDKKPILLTKGNWVLFDTVEKLISFGSQPTQRQNGSTVEQQWSEPKAEVTATDDVTEILAELGNIDVHSEEIPRRKEPRSKISSASCSQDKVMPLSKLLSLSSEAYPLTPSPFLSASPPALSPFLFGIPDVVDPIDTTMDLKTDSHQKHNQARNREHLPITTYARPSSPSIPLLNRQLGPSRKPLVGTIRKPLMNSLTQRNKAENLRVNHHLPPM
eukprot:GILI01013468.1.p1 GENE.GILI01013468.1~~GILI01013468.1.p1  ORF type:complete len:1285 (+),score=31.28 GILI01013468.1:215-3856(+)